ncbi:MAG: TIGR04282 family arsenosugar biosynthesis glycosyltransferase [Candidatus Omnitrophica bacterium]|nr:TIGR04282 family arsenosugar biosynthesis glycosyltransferase [Candidatus Omnitrophota bacterium]MCB9746931.1 TIGR04282 family arsenosugar biosynthesis glycosyltransferase [Candidatus Omnitrophota bacterium]
MSIEHKTTALIIFAREPKLGKVKTRLAKDIGKEDTLKLYQLFLKHIFAIAKKVTCDQKFIFYVGHGRSLPFLRQFTSDFILRRQTGADLGQRMYRAFKHVQQQGYQKVVIIGTDCLTISTFDLQNAFRKLERNDCVIGPAHDGGYYLLGLRVFDLRLFSGIKWSSEWVYAATIQKFKKLHLSYAALAKQEDVDRIDNLRRTFKKIQNNAGSAALIAFIRIILKKNT